MSTHRFFTQRMTFLVLLAVAFSLIGGFAFDANADGNGIDPPPPDRPGDTIGDTTSNPESIPGETNPQSEVSFLDVFMLSLSLII